MYLSYSASLKYPTRQYTNPVAIKSPDAIPSMGTFSYVSNGDTNDMIYYLGTKGGAFANPHDSGLIVVSGTGTYGAGYEPQFVTDRNASTQYFSASQTNPYIQIDFKGYAPRITRISFKVGTSNFGISPLTILGSNDNINYTILINNLTANGAGGAWVTPSSFINNAFYRYYRFMRLISSSLLTCQELQCYGEMPLNA